MPRLLRIAALTCLLPLLLAGCAHLQNLRLPAGLQPKPPRIGIGAVQLVQAPSNRMLAAWYCPRFGPGLLCQAAFGPQPAQQSLRFRFDVHLNAANDNAFPVPVVEVLTAFKAFPGAQGQQNLGAVCLTFCEQGAECAQNAPGACQAQTGQDVRTLADFAHATAGFLLAVGAGQASFDQLRVQTVPAGGTAAVRVQLELGLNAVLALLEKVGQQSLQQLAKGQQPAFAIPYELQGAAWVRVERFGRLGAGFGPLGGLWQLH